MPFFCLNSAAKSPALFKRIEMVACSCKHRITARSAVGQPLNSIISHMRAQTSESNALEKSTKV